MFNVEIFLSKVASEDFGEASNLFRQVDVNTNNEFHNLVANLLMASKNLKSRSVAYQKENNALRGRVDAHEWTIETMIEKS